MKLFLPQKLNLTSSNRSVFILLFLLFFLTNSFSQTLTITSDTTWNTFIYLDRSVVVDSGAVLTIAQDALVAALSDAKITIKPGAKIILNGGTLTNACMDKWQGIEVWGNPDLAQTEANQGTLIIGNGGTIVSAEVAVRAGRAGISGFGGGIVKATNAIIRNNTTGIWFEPCSAANNISYFRTCTFDYTDYLDDGSGFMETFTFVYLNQVQHVMFTGCNFYNNSNLPYAGKGIYSYNAMFYAGGYCIATNGSECTDWDEGTFNNLSYGIYATVSSSSTFAEVKHANFVNNYRGVYLSGMTNALVSHCNFEIDAPFQNNGGYGLYLDNSTAYTIEENNFFSEEDDRTGLGMVVHNSGTAANQVYRNWFTGLEQGISAQELNRSNRDPAQGLRILCCEFDDCDADILIPKPSLKTMGIDPNQGANSTNPEDMAGNLFDIHSQTANGDYDDINNQGTHIVYYYASNSNDDAVKPIDYTQNTVTIYQVQTSPAWTFLNSCPTYDSAGSTGSGIGMRSTLNESTLAIAGMEQNLSLMVDGGNTENLYDEVETSLPPETMDVYNELIANSPYLSDTVMGAAIAKEDVLPGVMLRDIMVANPHTAKSDVLLAKLDERFEPLPDYMKAQILAGRSMVSIKEELESKLSKKRLTKARALSGLVHYYNRPDSIPAGNDSILNLLAQDNDIQSKYRQCMMQMDVGNYTQAETLLQAIPNQYNLTGEQLSSHQHIAAYLQLCRNVQQSSGGWYRASSTQINNLHDFTQTSMPVSVYARNLLMVLNKLEYEEPVVKPDLLKATQMEEAYLDLLQSKAPNMLEVYPNPAKDYVVLGHHLDKTEVQGTLFITNIKGDIQFTMPIIQATDKHTVNTRDWPTGTYILSLMMDTRVMESIKFTIID